MSAESREVAQNILRRYSRLAWLLDQAFRIPATRWRFGLDPILGLVPGLGDLFTAILGAYGVLLARQLGAPASIQIRMMLNLVADAVAGALPVVGDIFDFAFKANARNLLLLEQWMATPRQARRTSLVFVVGTLIGMLLIAAGAIWLVAAAIHALFQLVR